ncbi:MAG TPA: aminopeptidase [Spirochaetia bacterium]|nr:aminopeptidase [Spirochaetales bacterium]HRW23586.1 aminopeptidase [Spirochaetia bacterium]
MVQSLLKLGAAAIAAVALASLLSSCWYVKQATHFLSERAAAVPVGRVAADPDTPPETVAMLEAVERVRRFAVERVGLSPTKNYTRYVALDRGYVADVVSACAADSFERYRWRYPVLGELPYKGFYDKADATREAKRLKEAGLDVIVRQVDAFSSLGYFKDPLYSFMASSDEDELAEMVIHESAHATLFVKGADQFNEGFATFVGRRGAELYLEERYGPGSPQAATRRDRIADGRAFVGFIRGTAALLEEAYADASVGRDARLERKAAIIAERAALFAAERERLFTGEAYRRFDMSTINNAYIDLYRLYEDDLGLFDAWFDRVAGGSLPEFVSTLSALAAAEGGRVSIAMAERLGLASDAVP